MSTRRFAHYEILGPIGRGGMGEVFKARDVRLGREVAIKLLPARLSSDPERRVRFMREARAAAALNHPNIANVFDVGEATAEDLEALEAEAYEVPGSAPVPYLVMEYVEGEDLRRRLERRRMPLPEVLELAVAITEGLAAAHRAGIVHRDLKPANVMIASDGRPKLLDFGLAKIVNGEASKVFDEAIDETRLTREGMIVGTVPYMAPEQLKGHGADARSDLFSLGVVLYEMIAGEPPFPAELIGYFKALGKGPESLLDSCPYLSPELASVVDKLLAQEPEERFQDANRVALELRELAQGSSGSRPAPMDDRPTEMTEENRPRPVGRSRRLWPLAAGGVLVALLVLAAFLYLEDRRRALRTEPRFNLAVLPFENATGDPNQEYFCEGLSRLLIPKLSRVRGINAVTSELGTDRVVTGRVERSPEGRVGIDLELARAPLAEAAEELSSRRFEGERDQVAELVRELEVWVLDRLEVPLSWGERREIREPFTSSSAALDHYLQALELFEERRPQDVRRAAAHLDDALELDPDFALAHAAQSEVSWWLYTQVERGDPALQSRAKRHAETAVELDPAQPETRIALAQVYRSSDPERAETSFKELTWEYPHLAEAHRQLAVTLRKAGDYCQAKESIERAIGIRPRFWVYRREHGIILYQLGRQADAGEAFAEAISLAPPGEVPSLAGNLAGALVGGGEFEKAIDSTKALGQTVENLTYLNSIAAAYFYMAQFEEAESYYGQILELFDRQDRRDNRGRVYALIGLGDVATQEGDGGKARGRYEAALDLLRSAPDLSTLDRDSYRHLEALLLAKLPECYNASRAAGELELILPEEDPRHATLAKVYALCERPEKALAQLEKAVRSGASLKVLRREPELQRLVDHPRFDALEVLVPEAPSCR